MVHFVGSMGAGQLKAASSLLAMPSQRGAVSSLQRTLAGPRPPFVLLASGGEAWRQQGVTGAVPSAQLLAAAASPALGLASIPRSIS